MKICRHSYVWLVAATVGLAACAPQTTPDPAPSSTSTPTPASTTVTEASSERPPPTSSVPGPIDGEAGSFETSLGLIDWRRVRGDEDSIPFPELGLVATQSGFAAIGTLHGEPNWRYYESKDGYEWAAATFPIPVDPKEARMVAAGDATWMITSGPETLWRSEGGGNWAEVGFPEESGTWGSTGGLQIYDVDGATWLIRSAPLGAFILDGSTWIEIDTSDFQPPDVTGGRWAIPASASWFPTAPVAVSGRTIVPLSVAFDVDWVSILGVDSDIFLYSVWNEATQKLGLWNPHPSLTLKAALDAEVKGREITITDPETGEQVHQIVVNDPRIDPTTLLKNGLNVGEYQIAVVDEQGVVTPGVAPWVGPSPDWAGTTQTALFATDQLATFMLARPQGEVAAVEAWTSSDGVNWTGPSQPGFIDDQPAGFVRFEVEGDVMLAYLLGDFGHDVWVTTDGTSWSFTGLSDVMGLARLGSGGLLYQDPAYSQRGMVASADLKTWEPVDPGSLEFMFEEPLGPGSAGGFAAGDAFFYIHTLGSGTRQMYVLKLQG